MFAHVASKTLEKKARKYAENKQYDKAENCYIQLGGNVSFNLGFMYHTMSPPNYKKAKYYYQKSAEEGNVFAMNNLGTLYLNGKGVPKNIDKALEYYLKALKKSPNEGFVLKNLGYIYQYGGSTIPIDFPKALSYYNAAAKNGYTSEAFRQMAAIYSLGNSEVPRNYQTAFYYFQESAKLNDRLSLYFVGYLYASGKGVSANSKKALEYYQKAADRGEPTAQFALAERYETGRDVSKDLKIALHYYHQSLLPESLLKLAKIYYSEKDFAKAIHYYRKAADLQFKDAIIWFKKMFYSIAMKPQLLNFQNDIFYHAAMVTDDKKISNDFQQNFLEDPELFIPFLEDNLLDTVEKLKQRFPDTFDNIILTIQQIYLSKFFVLQSLLPSDMGKLILKYCIQAPYIQPILDFSPSFKKREVNPFHLFYYSKNNDNLKNTPEIPRQKR